MGNTLNWGTAEAVGSIEDLKAYLRISGTDEDDVLTSLLAAASAIVEGELGTPRTAAERTDSVCVAHNETYLKLYAVPVDPDETITILDPDGEEWDSGYFVLDADAGLLMTEGTLEGRVILTEGTWTVTYTGGLSVRSDYDDGVETIVDTAIMLTAADLWANRNPRATAERDGDVSVSLGDNAAHVHRMLSLYRRPL